MAVFSTVPLAWSAANYELRDSRVFENEIDEHNCNELVVKGRSIAWVYGLRETAVGLVTRICEQRANTSASVAVGSVNGGVEHGWFVIDPADGSVSLLTLPELDELSNPTYCGQFAAYWGMSRERDVALVIADLSTKSVVKKVNIGRLELATENLYHFRPAVWDRKCASAVFNDERYFRKTSLSSQSAHSFSQN